MHHYHLKPKQVAPKTSPLKLGCARPAKLTSKAWLAPKPSRATRMKKLAESRTQTTNQVKTRNNQIRNAQTKSSIQKDYYIIYQQHRYHYHHNLIFVDHAIMLNHGEGLDFASSMTSMPI